MLTIASYCSENVLYGYFKISDFEKFFVVKKKD